MTMEENQNMAKKFCQTMAEHMQMALEDEASVLTCYRGFHVQVSFSLPLPMVTVSFMKDIPKGKAHRARKKLNRINLMSPFGCHAISLDEKSYIFKSGYQLPSDPTASQLLEILDCCADSAGFGYRQITS